MLAVGVSHEMRLWRLQAHGWPRSDRGDRNRRPFTISIVCAAHLDVHSCFLFQNVYSRRENAVTCILWYRPGRVIEDDVVAHEFVLHVLDEPFHLTAIFESI